MAEDPRTGQAVEAPPAGAQIPETQPLAIPKTSTSASRRVRARLARRMTAQRSAVNPVLEPLVAVHREKWPKANVSLLQKAYEVAEVATIAVKRAAASPRTYQRSYWSCRSRSVPGPSFSRTCSHAVQVFAIGPALAASGP